MPSDAYCFDIVLSRIAARVRRPHSDTGRPQLPTLCYLENKDIEVV